MVLLRSALTTFQVMMRIVAGVSSRERRLWESSSGLSFAMRGYGS